MVDGLLCAHRHFDAVKRVFFVPVGSEGDKSAFANIEPEALAAGGLLAVNAHGDGASALLRCLVHNKATSSLSFFFVDLLASVQNLLHLRLRQETQVERMVRANQIVLFDWHKDQTTRGHRRITTHPSGSGRSGTAPTETQSRSCAAGVPQRRQA